MDASSMYSISIEIAKRPRCVRSRCRSWRRRRATSPSYCRLDSSRRLRCSETVERAKQNDISFAGLKPLARRGGALSTGATPSRSSRFGSKPCSRRPGEIRSSPCAASTRLEQLRRKRWRLGASDGVRGGAALKDAFSWSRLLRCPRAKRPQRWRPSSAPWRQQRAARWSPSVRRCRAGAAVARAALAAARRGADLVATRRPGRRVQAETLGRRIRRAAPRLRSQMDRRLVGERGDDAGWRDLANRDHAALGDVNVAGSVDSNAGGRERSAPRASCAVQCCKAAPASPARVVTSPVRSRGSSRCRCRRRRRCRRHRPRHRKDREAEKLRQTALGAAGAANAQAGVGQGADDARRRDPADRSCRGAAGRDVTAVGDVDVSCCIDRNAPQEG